MRTIILLIAISLLPILLSSQAAESGVTQAVITTGVTSGARPETANLSVIDSRVGSVTFYTEIVGLRGQTVTHRWFYNGKELSSVTLNLASAHSINWSRSSIASTQLGKWEARVVDQNGRVLASRSFSVVESGQSVAQIIQEKQVDSCSVKLAELKEKMLANPTVAYYKFLYDKQLKRCQN
jgi:hypothetical protein